MSMSRIVRPRRRSVRRAVGLHCQLQSELWDELLPFCASDLSNEGMWIASPLTLDPGDEVVVAFTPPGALSGQEIWATAEVIRVGLWRRSRDPWPAGMGLAFTYCSASDRRLLARCLLGCPPRLPVRRKPPPLQSVGSAP